MVDTRTTVSGEGAIATSPPPTEPIGTPGRPLKSPGSRRARSRPSANIERLLFVPKWAARALFSSLISRLPAARSNQAYTVTKLNFGMIAAISFHLLPVILVIPDFLAVATDGQQATHGAYLTPSQLQSVLLFLQ